MTAPTGFEDLFPKDGSDMTDLFGSPANPVAAREQQRLAANVANVATIRAKRAAGKPLTKEEATLLAQDEAYKKLWSGVGAVLQPFQALNDVTLGVLGEMRGVDGAFFRATKAAGSHMTWGALENRYMPWMAGARAQGVKGEELLRGTQWEGNRDAALAVELLADPSLLLLGAGAAVKGGATAGRLAQLEKLAKTADGAEMIRGALLAANKRGEQIIRLSDEITGVPAVVRAGANGKVGQVVKGAAQRVANAQLPDWVPFSGAIRREGGGTVGDAFLTPDQKGSLYDPAAVARDNFRADVRIKSDELATDIKGAATADAKVAANITKGLKPADAAEVNRLLGVFTTTTDPAIAAEALRKVRAIGAGVGKDLEKPFVAAVQALDRTSQQVLGANLAARGLPAVVDPAVTQAIQAAQNGDDLLPLIGKYGTEAGRPRGILMTTYTGRNDPARVIDQLSKGPEIPAQATLDTSRVQQTLEASPLTDPLPPRPVEPVGVAATGELPRNAPTLAERITSTEVTPTPAGARKDPAQAGAAADMRSPAQVLDDLFTTPTPKASELTTVTTPQNVLNDLLTGKPAAAPTTPTAPRVEPATQPSPTSPGIQNVFSQASGSAVDNLYDMLFTRYQAGKTTELGVPSVPLIATQRLKARGIELDRAEFQTFINEVMRVPGPDRAAFVDSYVPVATRATTPSPAPAVPATQAITPPAAPRTEPGTVPTPDAPPVTKTPQNVLSELLIPNTQQEQTFLPAARLDPTPQGDLKDVALPSPTPERMVERAVPTTYRTVEVDANALDWAALPDDAARRAVLNSIEGAGNARFVPDATGTLRMDRPNLTVPLNHPVISRYFSDGELMAAQRQGTDLGERTIVRREQVPDWYNPKDPAPMAAQRAMHEQAQREAVEQAYPNDARHLQDQHEILGDDSWLLGDAFASWDRVLKPGEWNTRAAANDYAARVTALTGRPPTRGEVFQYRLQLARYRQAVNARNLKPADVADHLTEFYKANPEATLYEGVLSAARAFDAGREGVRYLQSVLRKVDSGFTRQLSSLERKEFAQMMLSKDSVRMAGGGGSLTARLLRRPAEVSQEFRQVFNQDLNALRVLDEQVRSRTAAIVRAETFSRYKGFLEDSGQLITKKKLAELRSLPASRLTPDQRAMREAAANAINRPGAQAGYMVMDRNVPGYFEKGDMLPWWAWFDLFGARSIDDAAVSSSILSRTYDRAFAAMNARLLGSLTSVVNDQIGQLVQMGMWGVTPDAVIEGMIRRATAKPEQLAAMRKAGLQSATLEHNIGADSEAIRALATRLDGDTDMSRLERVVDGVLRFAERSSGINPQAMTGAAGVAADVAGLGSAYVFRARSKMSDLQRESLYFHRLQLGDTPTQAAQYANTVMLDMRLVPAYARVVRRFWPFFNWIAMSGPRSIITILRKPQLNAAYQRVSAASDAEDPQADTRRILARDGGYINLGIDERSGARLYLDPRNWDPTNTIPQLLDWGGTKVGAVDLPWFVNLALTVQGGTDRFGRNIYAEVLDGGQGGYQEAAKIDLARTRQLAWKQLVTQFQPSYAPGSSRAQAWVKSVLATAQLPQDGSRDVALAHWLTGSDAGQAYLLWMQSGTFAGWAERDLIGVRESPYVDAAPSMARAGLSFLLPLRGINADQGEQGTAMQAMSTGKLQFQSWLANEKKKLAGMEAAGVSPERIRQEEDRIQREADRRGGQLDFLDQITRP